MPFAIFTFHTKYHIFMTATNPHPLANPFNQRRYAAYEMPAPKKVITRCSDPSKLTVPQPTMTYDEIIERQRALTVPDTAPVETYAAGGAFGFINDSSLFRLGDGSVIDIRTRKIVFDPNIKFKAAGYWRDPNETIARQSDMEWGKTPSIDALLASCDSSKGEMNDPNLSPESIKYWQRAREESKKLESSMTDEQKKLLDELNSEQFFPMSRLEEE